ncbi:unnamed protein product [Acanthoscelides obtectus]|uniref:Uncharacterized protein n=1 Tax=Acanthoscelides obtectus TaxID=200917 RepID=A0A9P0LMB7_ACAOB|nr:unnamed protein product [Acanthoscelides obtectus]CAK1672175.1 hypothetical protein AOBTE_LOCUS28696 [Acanthoscelides obtectus]
MCLMRRIFFPPSNQEVYCGCIFKTLLFPFGYCCHKVFLREWIREKELGKIIHPTKKVNRLI